MALTKEQFTELRKKGLSVDQIIAFESGNKPAATPQQSEFRESKPFKDTFTGMAKEAGRIGLGIGSLGRGLQKGISKLTGLEVRGGEIFDQDSEQRQKAEEFLKPDSTAERSAGFVTGVAGSLIPGGATYKATRGLGFAARMIGRSTVGGAVGTIQGGGDLDKDTLIGAGTEVAFPVVGKAVGYGGSVLKGLAGLVSGKGSDVIEQIVKTPKAALEGGKGPSSQILKETASEIRNGVKAIRSKAGSEFEALTKNHTKPLDKKAFDKLVSSYLDDINETSFISTAKLDKIKGVVNTWDDYSPQGLNKLASKISKFYSGSDSAKDIDSVVSGLNRTIRDWVGEQVPDIADANARYADKMDLIEQLDAIFRVKGSVDGRIGMQKTAESIGRLFNANKDIAREGVEEIEKELGINVLGKEAGRQLVDGVSRSQSAIGDFATGITRAVIPPKALLQLTAGTGMAKEAIENRLNTLDPAARATVVEFLTNLFGEDDQ